MIIVIGNRKMVIGRKQMILGLGLFVMLLVLAGSGFAPVAVIFVMGLVYLLLRFATKPLSRVIARLGYSIRWKFEIAIGVIAALFAIVSLINFAAMDYMHKELHEIQELRPFDVLQAVDKLEDTHHGLIFSMTPYLDVLGVLVAAALGGAIAWSVIDPVRRIGQMMNRIASGDFSQRVEVENNDELGELANRANETSEELAKLQDKILAGERDRALRERIIQVTTAQEEERLRISRELHDGLGPSLAAIGNRLRASQYLVRTNPQKVEHDLEEIATSLKGHVQDVRELIYDLRPLCPGSAWSDSGH